MMGWASDPVTLPRLVVWALLLTSPSEWSGRFTRYVRERLGGQTDQNATDLDEQGQQ